nr:acetyltransf_3 [uncultured bacterium]
MNKDIDLSTLELKTDRLFLRPFTMEDLEDLNAYASVEGVGEMAGWSHHESMEESEEILKQFIEEKKTLAIVKDDKVIGSIGVERYDEQDHPEFHALIGREIGFVLSKDYWGQGLMAEAVEKVLDYLFNEEYLEFVLVNHFKDNEQSKRVIEKAGFTYLKEVIFHKFDEARETLVYIKERPE